MKKNKIVTFGHERISTTNTGTSAIDILPATILETNVSTVGGRLNNSKLAITALAESDSLGQNPIIFDIGVGWNGLEGPITTRELSASVMQKSEIIGIDFRFPTIVVTRKDNRGYALYHKEDTRPYSIQFDGKYLYGELITTNLANEFNAIKASNDPNLVHHEVINTFETPNLRFMENNLFKFDATKLSEKKASLIRIANLLLRYGNIEDIGIALENLLPATKEDGIVLIGGSPLHEIGASKEEYFIYTKKQVLCRQL